MSNPTPANPNMADTLLFEHFATLATAPDGIARLRELILQLAVQGKLGTQDAGDEPADVLAEKILKEKKRLIAQRKIKREERIDQIKVEDIQFEIPKSWQWVKLGNICNQITDGTHVTPKYISEGIPFLSVKNFSKGFIDFSATKFISQEAHSEFIKRCKPEMNDLILTKVGTTGIAKVVDTEKEFSIFVSLALLKFTDTLIFPKYLELALNSPLGKVQSKFYTQGMGNQNLVLKSIKIFNLPLPPLAEQHRIVEKVARLMALCDKLEARQQQERAGCLKLGTASLAGLQNAESPEEFGRQWAQVCDAFDMILDCPENVAVLRQTILQLAVQGRLVQQEPGDKPVGKFVERLVKEGKIKREKPLESIREEEKAYSIPNHWTWIRLGEIIESMANGIYKPGVFYSDDGIACLRMYNINSGKINFKNLKRMVLNDQEMRQYLLKQGDLLVNRVNSRELVGKAAVIPDIKEPVIFESKNIRVRFNTDIILPGFVNILFQTKEVWQVWQGNAKQTCGQASVSQPQIAGICTPLPPLAEQLRIVAKVDALMGLCDALESRLKERAGVQGRLARAVVKMVAGG